MAEKIGNAKGFFGGDPAFRVALAACAALAVTSGAADALAIGLATACVLILGRLIVSLAAGALTEKGRLIVYLVLASALAGAAQRLCMAFAPALDGVLGSHWALIAIAAMLLGGVEAAQESSPAAAIGALRSGLTFAALLAATGIARELIGCGSVFGQKLSAGCEPMLLVAMPVGGALILGLALGIWNAVAGRGERKGGESA